MAKKKASSPGKRSTKAATRTRSTTSSTTDKVAKPRNVNNSSSSSDLQICPVTGHPFDQTHQDAYVKLLSLGASPGAACEKLGLTPSDVADHLQANESFRDRVAGVNDLLSQNVAAALYRSAMEGSVSAQTFFLKNRPPPEWPMSEVDPQLQPLDELTDDEIIAQFRQEAPALLARLAAEDSPAESTGAS